MREDRTEDNLKMLDSIDFLPFIGEAPVRVGELMSKIEKFFNETDFVNNDVMHGFVFNWVGQSELCDYLEKRYPKFRHYEVCDEYCYVDYD